LNKKTEASAPDFSFFEVGVVMSVFGFVALGYEGELVRVEVDVRPGIPGMEIVGLPSGAVREARERIRIAWKNTGFKFPQERILVNLSPADLPKTGAGFDLPMAIALLEATGQVPQLTEPFLALGELALDGSLRRVAGILPALAKAAELGIKRALLPSACQEEAEALSGIEFISGPNLSELVENLKSQCWRTTRGMGALERRRLEFDAQVGIWRARPQLSEALAVAAAGGHSVLLYGPPGGGKTVAARSLRVLTPSLEPEEAWEVARLRSLRGEDNHYYPEVPFREPHHAANLAGLVGGGRSWEPGEASLAHRGILFLDEAPQFAPSFLQTLREPLEDGWLRLARAGRQVSYPARFQLVMTANACPCGQAGRVKGVCLCGAQTIRRYWDRLGGALIDRVDLRIFLNSEAEAALEGPQQLQKTLMRLENALARRRSRKIPEKNAWRDWREVLDATPLRASQKTLWRETLHREDWSSRGGVSLIRMARTLADLDDRDQIRDEDLLQSISFRKPAGEQYWQN
jgi:magnesium chelatase family protein